MRKVDFNWCRFYVLEHNRRLQTVNSIRVFRAVPVVIGECARRIVDNSTAFTESDGFAKRSEKI